MDNGADAFRVLVTGGREYTDREFLNAYLDAILEQLKGGHMILIAGGAAGADSLARDWGVSKGGQVTVIIEKADWRRHGKGAGPIRNQRMLDLHHPKLCVAFPGGVGTANMIHLAHRDGVPVVRAVPKEMTDD